MKLSKIQTKVFKIIEAQFYFISVESITSQGIPEEV